MSCQGNKSSFTNRQRPTLSTARFFHYSTDRTAAALRKPQKQKLENKFPQCLYLELCLTFLISTANFLRGILQLSTQQLATIHIVATFLSHNPCKTLILGVGNTHSNILRFIFDWNVTHLSHVMVATLALGGGSESSQHLYAVESMSCNTYCSY